MNERFIAWAQLVLTVIFVTGYFGTLYVVLFGQAMLAPEMVRFADGLAGALTAMLAQQGSYWFARQRQYTGEIIVKDNKFTPTHAELEQPEPKWVHGENP